MNSAFTSVSQTLSNIYTDIVKWDHHNSFKPAQYHWEIASHKDSKVKMPSDQEKKASHLIFLKWNMLKSVRVTF